jgi:quinol monooxygenase YgiN
MRQIFFPVLFLFSLLHTGCTTGPTPAPPSATSALQPMTEATDVVVTVNYQAQPGKGEALHAAMQELLSQVRREPHFISLTELRDANDPDRIQFLERWSDRAYFLGPHGETEHLQAFIGRAMPLLVGPPEVVIWEEVADVLPEQP